MNKIVFIGTLKWVGLLEYHFACNHCKVHNRKLKIGQYPNLNSAQFIKHHLLLIQNSYLLQAFFIIYYLFKSIPIIVMCSGKGNRNSLCDCHCGTRLDVNPQLLEERETWRLKCEQLELQYKEDLKNLKDKIYKQCSTILEQQLRAKQQAFKEVQKKRMVEYQALHQRLIPMEPKMDELLRENEFLKKQIKQLQQQVRDAENRLQSQRRYHGDDMKQLINRHQHYIQDFEKQKQQDFDRERKELEAQIYHLRHQISDFESKYRQILPQLQKLKHTLHNKTSEVEDLRSRLGEEVSRVRNDSLADTANRRTTRRPSDQTLQFEYRALQRQLDEKNRQIQKLKNGKQQVKTEIKYQTVYIDRPVEVEKVVERIVEVQKIVKEYVEPKQPVVVNQIICDDGKEDYDQLVTEINNRTRYISELQNQLAHIIRQNQQYQIASEQYQRNIQKYKAERQNLALTISNKNREIQSLENKIQVYFSQQNSAPYGAENKIVVNVKKDGTYSSTVEKVQKGGVTTKKK